MNNKAENVNTGFTYAEYMEDKKAEEVILGLPNLCPSAGQWEKSNEPENEGGLK